MTEVAAARPAFDTVEVGQELPARTYPLRRRDLIRYAGASGDFNVIHWSDRLARQAGLPDVIAHGMLTMATAVRLVTEWCGDPGAVREYGTRFTRPVVVPDDADGVDVEFGGSVSAIEGSLVTVSIEAISAGQKVLGAARAEVDLGVRVPRRDHEI